MLRVFDTGWVVCVSRFVVDLRTKVSVTSFFELNPVISVTSFLKTKRRALSKGLSLNETFEIGFRV